MIIRNNLAAKLIKSILQNGNSMSAILRLVSQTTNGMI